MDGADADDIIAFGRVRSMEERDKDEGDHDASTDATETPAAERAPESEDASVVAENSESNHIELPETEDPGSQNT